MRLLGDMLQDVRFALRSWARTPGWLLVAVASMGLGVGAATTVIGSIDRTLRRPPPGLDGVVAITLERAGVPQATSVADHEVLSGAAGVDIAGYRRIEVNIGAERYAAAAVSPAFFRVTAADPLIGRLPGDAAAERDRRVAVLAEGFWRRAFGGDPAVIGRTVLIDGAAVPIAGVLPAEFVFPGTDVALWLPLDAGAVVAAAPPAAASAPLLLLGRLWPGGSTAAAAAALDARMHAAAPAPDPTVALRVRPVQALYVTETLRTAARVGIVTALFVLLIACANVATLLLARGVTRQRELAVRRSLGASRGRLARQLLAEAAVVAVLGGALGLLVAVWGGQGLLHLWSGLADTRPFPDAGAVDLNMVGVAVAATALAALLFGLAPALHAARAAPAHLLGAGERAASPGPRAGRAQRTLVVAQVALALALISSAALLARSFMTIQRAELGFRTTDVLGFRVSPAPDAPFLDRLRALPGVAAAGAAESLPLDGAGRRTRYLPAGTAPGAGEWSAPLRVVTPGYIEALGIPLVRGRALRDTDHAGAPPAVVVNRAFLARHAAHGLDLGSALLIDGTAFGIVGVVADTREWGPHSDGPAMIYASAAQLPPLGAMAYVLRADGAPGTVMAGLRGTVAAHDPGAALHDAASFPERLRWNTARSQLMVRVMAIFAGVALLLALAGVHATIAHVTIRRIPELAVRRALGATARGIVTLVLRQGLTLVLGGVAAGALLAFGAARLLARFLVGVGPADVLAVAAAALLIVGAALAACLGPAWRAGRTAPLQALHGTSRHWTAE